MGMVLLVILGVAILASFFVAYMSAQNWPIYQAVLVVFIFLGAVVFFYLGVRTLATHKAWRNLVQRRQEELANWESQILPLRGGISPQGQAVEGEIPRLKNELEKVTNVRGGVYYDVTADVKDKVVQLTFKAPEPGLVPNTVLFAFDQKPRSEGGRYLGEFKVVAAPEGNPTVQIAPTLPLSDAQTKQLAAALPGTWTLYTTMPPDEAAVFAGLDDAARQALLPPQSAADYAREDRELRDYRAFFHDNYVQRALLAETIANTTTKIERTEAATKQTEAEAKFRETEKANLAADLQNFQMEGKAIAAYAKSLEEFLTAVRARLRATYIENRQATMTLVEKQLEAAEQIDRRTTAAAP
jgi:hypothetical protein